jgi:hypothetical protein
MKLRTLLILLAVLAFLDAGLSWLGHTRRSVASNAGLMDRPLLDLPVLEQAHRIIIREKPQSKVLFSNDDGFEIRRIVDPATPIRETVLERNADQRWVVANCLGLDADPNWLGQTMRDLSEGRLIRYVTDDPKLMDSLGLNAAQVRFEDGNGRVIRRLDFGRKDGGDSYQFVRVDQGSVFLAKHETELVGDPLTWIVSRLLSFEPADVREIELPFQNALEPPLLLRRAARGGPLLPAEGTLPAGASQTAEKILAHLLTSPVTLAVSRDSPAARIARQNIVASIHLVLFDGREYKLNYGAVPKGTTGLKDLEDNEPETLAFGFYESSDPQDITARYNSKAVLIYSRSATVGLLPADRAGLSPPPAANP